MAQKKITDLTLRSNVDGTVNFPSDDGVQSYRVTATQLKEFVLSASAVERSMITAAERIPIGSVTAFAGATAPTGHLLCYGQEVSRTTYADLFSVISTAFGVGNGTTTFNLPDCRGRVIAGIDNMGGSAASRLTSTVMTADGNTMGATGGTQTHTLTGAQSGTSAHTHTATHAHTHFVVSEDNNTENIAADTVTSSNYVASQNIYSSSSANYALSGSSTVANEGLSSAASTNTVTVSNSTAADASSAHLNTQPTILMNYIIKY